MISLEMKNCNMILTKKHKKYQHYHEEKFIKGKKGYLPIEGKL